MVRLDCVVSTALAHDGTVPRAEVLDDHITIHERERHVRATDRLCGVGRQTRLEAGAACCVAPPECDLLTSIDEHSELFNAIEEHDQLGLLGVRLPRDENAKTARTTNVSVASS